MKTNLLASSLILAMTMSWTPVLRADDPPPADAAAAPTEGAPPADTGLENAADHMEENAAKNEGHGKSAEVLKRNAERKHDKAAKKAERKAARAKAKHDKQKKGKG
jgi:hypothetical protein